MPRRHLLTVLLALVLLWSGSAAQDLALPNRPDSLKFAAIGDMGTGEKPQYEVAQQMVNVHAKFPFELVIMLGDNLYGTQKPADFILKFDRPYKPLLDAGVKFYAALGNHDEQNNRYYKPWNMNGERFYTYTAKNVRFVVLDSDYMDRPQLQFAEKALKDAKEAWKIVYFHHPLYSSGGRHGSEVDLRVVLEPLFVKYGVNVVFSGHDHIYERIKPQKGIAYFIAGSSAKLRTGNIAPSALSDKGFDTGFTFMLVEIDGEDLYFQTVTEKGATIDSGTIHRVGKVEPTPNRTAQPVVSSGAAPKPAGPATKPTTGAPNGTTTGK